MLTVLLVQITLIYSASIGIEIVTPDQLNKIADTLIEMYMNDRCAVIISVSGYMASSSVPAVYVSPYSQKTAENLPNASLASEESYKKDVLAPVLELGCTGYLVQAENPEVQFRLIEKTFVHVKSRTQRRFIFLPTIVQISEGSTWLPSEVLDTSNFDFQSVLQGESVQYVTDVVFAVPNNRTGDVDLFTHRFSGPDDAGRQEILLDTYEVENRKFKLGANLFPDKVKNLEGKTLRIAAFDYPPYNVMVNKEGENYQFDGAEWRFAVEFAKLHNCSLKPVVDNEDLWGVINENLTGNGVIGNLVEDKADVGIAALWSWHHEFRFLDFTAPSYRAGMTCFVPEPKRIPQWMSPIFPFAPSLWATFITMIFVSIAFTGIVIRGESFVRFESSSKVNSSEIVLTVLGVMLLQGLVKEPDRPSWAALAMTLLVVSLLLATAYGSSLASAMTIPRFKAPIDTAMELAASGISWAANHESWLYSIINAEEPEMRTLVKNFRVLTPAELTRNAAKNGWAFPIERLPGGLYSIQDYLNSDAIEKMHMMRTDINFEYCVAMLRKSSPYTQWYTRRILEIQASGIPSYWGTDVVQQHLDIRTQLAVHSDNIVTHDPVKMTVGQVQGTFYILAIGLAISGLVFLKELYSAQKSSRQRKKEIKGY
ncbi:glutamate receptor 3-like [Diprion similis]|uniref:glutamate receptor 3-like n=1 Tax=Diprion similis TaxID=362088 RepID=UPI001EF7C193|nr:glutamate receptor 3-like [Diprion similis]